MEYLCFLFIHISLFYGLPSKISRNSSNKLFNTIFSFIFSLISPEIFTSYYFNCKRRPKIRSFYIWLDKYGFSRVICNSHIFSYPIYLISKYIKMECIFSLFRKQSIHSKSRDGGHCSWFYCSTVIIPFNIIYIILLIFHYNSFISFLKSETYLNSL